MTESFQNNQEHGTNDNQALQQVALIKMALDQAEHLRVPFFECISKPEAHSLFDMRALWLQPVTPYRVPKSSCPAVVPACVDPGDVPVKRKGWEPTHMAMLMVDIDGGNHTLETVRSLIVDFFGDDTMALIYSTSSSMPEQRRWRLVVPFSAPTASEVWLRTAKAFSLFATKRGIELDPAMERCTQMSLLPCVPDEIVNKDGTVRAKGRDETGKPLHFEYEYWGHRLHEAGVPSTQKANEAYTELQRLEERARRRIADRAQLIGHGSEYLTPIDFFNEDNDTEYLLQNYGYIENPEKPGHWRSPLQTSESYATMLLPDGSWFSLSASDCAAGLGRACEGKAGCHGDAFDLYAYFEHSNDRSAARESVARSASLAGRTLVDSDLRVFEVNKARRQRQQEENQLIGRGTIDGLPIQGVITLNEALEQLVYIADGAQVCFKDSPNLTYKYNDFRKLTAASEEAISGRFDPNSGTPIVKRRCVADLWMKDERRATVITRTFRAGDGLYTADPEGHGAINTWRPFHRENLFNPVCVDIFLNHVRWLFGERTEDFLDWLAHIEQVPGVLPHSGWLHVATRTGLGRNWLAGVLARVWSGYVASSFNLSESLNKGFNGDLAGRILAIVDEIKLGGISQRWFDSQALKEMMTAERRLVNPKYGHQFTEHNACRWLIFSNHINAIPLEESDRRFNIVVSYESPKDGDYYSRLYAALADPLFIASIAAWLRQRDISRFNPGARPLDSEARKSVILASTSEIDFKARYIISDWPSDIIDSKDLATCFCDLQTRELSRTMASALVDANAQRVPVKFKLDGRTTNGWILRNHAKWIGTTGVQIAAEVKRGKAAAGAACAWAQEHIDGDCQCLGEFSLSMVAASPSQVLPSML